MPHNSGPATFFLKQKTKLYMENLVLGTTFFLVRFPTEGEQTHELDPGATGIFPIQAWHRRGGERLPREWRIKISTS